MSDRHEEIAELEARIAELSEAADRCGRGMLVAKAAAIVGLVLLAAMLAGLIGFSPLLFVLGVSGGLGGVALFGSTRSTRDQIVATRQMHEAQRAALIDGLALHEVGNG